MIKLIRSSKRIYNPSRYTVNMYSRDNIHILIRGKMMQGDIYANRYTSKIDYFKTHDQRMIYIFSDLII